MYKSLKALVLVLGLMCFMVAPASAEVLVQVMSVKSESAASDEANRLFSLGIPAFSRTGEASEGSPWARVFIGPFDTKKDATAAAESLKSQGTIKEYLLKTVEETKVTETEEAPVANEPQATTEELTAGAANATPLVAETPSPTVATAAPKLPVAQTPTYGEPVSSEQTTGLQNSESNEYRLSTYGNQANPTEAKADHLSTYGQAETKTNTLPHDLKPGDDLPGFLLESTEAELTIPKQGDAASVNEPTSQNKPLVTAPSAGDAPAPIMVAQSMDVSQPSYGSAAGSPMKIAGFTALVDLSSSMRRLIPCGHRIKEEAVAGLLRKMNQRIPNHPYNATLRVFGYKIAYTKKDFTTVYYGPEIYNRELFGSALTRLAAADSVSPFATALDTADNELVLMGNPKAVLMFSDFESSVGSGNPINSAGNLRRRYNQNVHVYTFYATRQNKAAKLAKDIAEAGAGKAYDICQMLDDDMAFENMMMEIFGPANNAPCPDHDQDGVCDGTDLCPKTPVGAPVDGRGCWIAAYSQFFDFDKAVVKEAFRSRLKHGAEILNRNPQITKLNIAGHTDNIGDPQYNLDLGKRRAQAVKDLLVQYGVAPSRLHVVSFGEKKPIAPNNTEEGRALNRRVEIHIGDVPEKHAH